jgi:hypothetical protein
MRENRRKVAIGAGLVALLILFLGWEFFWNTNSAKRSELASREEPSPVESPQGIITPATTPEETPAPAPDSRAQAPVIPPKITKKPERLPQPGPPEPPVAKPPERPIPRRPAEAGIYETVKLTSARREPNELSEVVDELGPGRKLNVIGSQGDWLVVKSTTRQITVYIKRDDAMLISGTESFQEAELRWKKVEAEITESLAKWSVTGVTASFSNDTAYLEGQVKTDYERFRAEMAAKSIPEVQHIINRIRLIP